MSDSDIKPKVTGIRFKPEDLAIFELKAKESNKSLQSWIRDTLIVSTSNPSNQQQPQPITPSNPSNLKASDWLQDFWAKEGHDFILNSLDVNAVVRRVTKELVKLGL